MRPMMQQRLQNEMARYLSQDPRCWHEDVRLVPCGDADGVSASWLAVIRGPQDSPYEGGYFEVDVKFPQMYPYQRVDLKFRTKLISVNVWHDGSQCHPRFRPHWIPSLTAVQAIGLLAEMLRCPNPDEPCSTELAKLYLDDRERYNELARQATITHAIEAYPPETLQRYATWFMPGVGPRLLIERIP